MTDSTTKTRPKIHVQLVSFIEYTVVALVGLMFFSKLSLKWTRVVPRNIPPLFFQHGMHPYINFALNFLGFAILLFYWKKKKRLSETTIVYKFFILVLLMTLSIQTIFQVIFVNVSFSPFLQLSGLGMAIILILLYSIIIPNIFPVEKMIFWIRNFSVAFVLISLLMLPLFYPYFFKGGRFIGVFKHIPHMVSASTFAFIYLIRDVFRPKEEWGRFRRNFNVTGLFLCGIAILMTSTKAAFVTMIMTFMAALFLFPSKRRSLVLFKISFLMLFTMGVTLFGGPAFNILYDVTTGKRSFGMRRAQNGIETRLEEVYRGMEYFQEEPVMGKGLLYKFMSGKGIKVSGYNSFKDPHNLFISAGVIGGWPLLILSVIGYLLMIYGAINGMLSASYDMRIMGIFLFSHLLVFVIYHAHFSLGGMGDRMYWLVFGYLGLNGINGIRQKRRPELFTKDSTFVMS